MATNMRLNLTALRRIARDSRGRPMSQKLFANLMGVDQSTLSRYEHGIGEEAMKQRLLTHPGGPLSKTEQWEAWGLRAEWLKPENLAAPHDAFLRLIGHAPRGDTASSHPPHHSAGQHLEPANSNVVPTIDGTMVTRFEELVGAYWVLRPPKASPNGSGEENPELMVISGSAISPVAKLFSVSKSPGAIGMAFRGTATLVGSTLSLVLSAVSGSKRSLSLICVPDGKKPVEVMMTSTTLIEFDAFSVTMTAGVALLARIRTPGRNTLDDDYAMELMSAARANPAALSDRRSAHEKLFQTHLKMAN